MGSSGSRVLGQVGRKGNRDARVSFESGNRSLATEAGLEAKEREIGRFQLVSWHFALRSRIILPVDGSIQAFRPNAISTPSLGGGIIHVLGLVYGAFLRKWYMTFSFSAGAATHAVPGRRV